MRTFFPLGIVGRLQLPRIDPVDRLRLRSLVPFGIWALLSLAAIGSLGVLSFSLWSSDKKELIRSLKSKSYDLFRQEKYSESLPYIRRYLEIQTAEVYMQLVYAQALLYREDLPIPTREEDHYSRNQKWATIRSNYGESARIFQEYTTKLEEIRPRDPSLGKWYYQWAMSELFSGNKEKALALFEKSVRKDFTLTDAYYNMGAISESLGQYSDAEKYWRRYYLAEKELNAED